MRLPVGIALAAACALLLPGLAGAGDAATRSSRVADIERGVPGFEGRAKRIDPRLRERMSGVSWHRRLVDAYGADDRRSMAADNTSAFNCRFVSGSPGVWSEHAYGRAIDVNPIENPYVTGSGYVSPPAGAPCADRARHRRGMIHRNGRW